MDNKRKGGYIRKHRNEAGISAHDMADALHVSIDTYKSLESGRRRWQPEYIKAACEALPAMPRKPL